MLPYRRSFTSPRAIASKGIAFTARSVRAICSMAALPRFCGLLLLPALLLLLLPGLSPADTGPVAQPVAGEATPGDAAAPEGDRAERGFSRLAARLPPGWDGEERSGFSSGNPEEYMLILGMRDETQERFVAQVSIYLLPNAPGADAETFARRMAGLQADASEPRAEGRFQVFEGEPRQSGPAPKGRATSMVSATPGHLLIIIVQDPEARGADAIVQSLRGLTPETRELLGR